MRQKIRNLFWWCCILLLSVPLLAFHTETQDFLEMLSPEERQYIEAAKPLVVAVSPNKGPIQYLDAKGQQKGISLDILDEAAALTGLQFEYVTMSGASTLKEALKDQRVQILSGIPVENEIRELYHVQFSQSYLQCPYGVVMHRNGNMDHVEELTLALTEGLDVPEALARARVIKRYATIQDCVRAVMEKDADLTYGNAYVLEFYTQGYQYQNLSVIPFMGEQQKLCFGVSPDLDNRLIGILNQAIDYIGKDGMMQITVKNVATSIEPVTLAVIIANNPKLAIGVSLFVLFLVLFAAFFFIMNYKHSHKLLYLEHQKRLLLAEIANEYFYEYSYKTDTLKLSKELAELFGCKPVMHRWQSKLEKGEQLAGFDSSQFSKLYGNVWIAAESAQGKGVSTLELQLPLQDGSERWFQLIRTDIFEEGGRYAVGMLRDIQKEHEERNALMKKSLCDSLTGIYNAAATKEFIADSLKKKRGGVLFVIDLDFFKQVNDRFGHQMGDQVIKETAHLLKRTFREGDIVGRVGGDEFVVFAQEVSSDSFIQMKCNQLQVEVNQITIGEDFRQTVSIGAAKAEDQKNYELLYQQADAALYYVKERGKAGFHIAGT